MVTTFAVGIVGFLLSSGIWLMAHGSANENRQQIGTGSSPIKGASPMQSQQNSGGTNQQSSGPNSPNIVGSSNRFSVYTGPIYPASKTDPGAFREAESLPENVRFSLGEGGMTAGMTIQQLMMPESKRPKLFVFDKFEPVRVRIEKGVIVCDVTLWAGKDKTSPVTIRGNQITVNQKGWDSNFTANAVEVVDENGRPVFQLIRESKGQFVFKGYLLAPNMVVVANEGAEFRPPWDVPVINIPRIFRYPSWKYPGQYEDAKQQP